MTFNQNYRTTNEKQKFRDAGQDSSGNPLTAVGIEGAVATSNILPNKLSSTVTFAAATTGSVAAHDLFTVTGTVAVTLFGVCTTNVAGSGTIEVGTAASTAGLIAQTTGTDIDANEIWHDASPDASIELASVATTKIVTDDIIYTIASDTLTSGVVTFYLSWYPISDGATVVVA